VKQGAAERLIRTMVARDPRHVAETILEFLEGASNGRAAAIFASNSAKTPKLLVGRGIGQGVLDWTAACWSRKSKGLAEGRLAREANHFLIPIVQKERLVALVYLETAQADLKSVEEVSDLIAKAVARSSARPSDPSFIESYLEQTPEAEIERRKLVLLLDRFEWNLSRVARELGKTRTTIYNRLSAFGIRRKRVSKGADNDATQGAAHEPSV